MTDKQFTTSTLYKNSVSGNKDHTVYYDISGLTSVHALTGHRVKYQWILTLDHQMN